jgi:hypothetical protein
VFGLDLSDAVKTAPGGHTGHTEGAKRDNGGLTLELAEDCQLVVWQEKRSNSHCLASNGTLVQNSVLVPADLSLNFIAL